MLQEQALQDATGEDSTVVQLTDSAKTLLRRIGGLALGLAGLAVGTYGGGVAGMSLGELLAASLCGCTLFAMDLAARRVLPGSLAIGRALAPVVILLAMLSIGRPG